jgi:hypothetical protein
MYWTLDLLSSSSEMKTPTQLILLERAKIEEVRSFFMTDGQPVSMSWYQAPLWDLGPDITSGQNVAV